MNPKRVPQMADAEDVLAALAPTPGARYIGLVLNRKGFDRARPRAAPRSAWPSPPAKASASATRAAASMRASRPGWTSPRRRASAGIRAQITISTAFGCPFEGEVPVQRVRRARRAARPPDCPMKSPWPTPSALRCPRRSPSSSALCVPSLPRRAIARALPQHPQHRSRQCLCRDRGGRSRAGRELRRNRRLSVRARGDRQYSHRRSHLHAASNGHRHRRRSARAARNQPLAATDARSCRARHGREGRTVSRQFAQGTGNA